MGRTTKLILDLFFGAVIPIAVLSLLSEPLGAVTAYLIAALIPVGWVAIDLLFLTRRFNFITSYMGFLALARGVLAFWFVDGWQFALKDTVGGIMAMVVIAGSLVMGRPMIELFWRQAMAPDTPEREEALTRLTHEPALSRAFTRGTLLVLVVMTLSSIANFLINLWIVTAPFGTATFNQQVAQVNAITRIALNIPEFAAYGVAFWMLFKAVEGVFKRDLGSAGESESDLWGALDTWVARGVRREA